MSLPTFNAYKQCADRLLSSLRLNRPGCKDEQRRRPFEFALAAEPVSAAEVEVLVAVALVPLPRHLLAELRAGPPAVAGVVLRARAVVGRHQVEAARAVAAPAVGRVPAEVGAIVPAVLRWVFLTFFVCFTPCFSQTKR